MHIYFSGIGGAGIGPLALIAYEAGFEVSGSDKQESSYIHYLKSKGISDIDINQSYEHINSVHQRNPIDWIIYTSALPIEHPNAPELIFAKDKSIRSGKRDDLINLILKEKELKLIAIAGTHGKTTTTSMTIWLFKCLGIPVSYSVGGKISFGEMGHYEPGSKYFVYEADEFDRNFLSFEPHMSLISGIDWDHPDIYPTRESYNDAFKQFLGQSRHTYIWKPDADKLKIESSESISVIDFENYKDLLHLPGLVNRQNASLVTKGIMDLLDRNDINELAKMMNGFPGVSRRFEQIIPGLYTDYAHTPPKIRGALQLAKEIAGDNVVVVYEGLHNTRQHFIKDELANLFDNVKKLYIVPSYLARENESLKLLEPKDLVELLSYESKSHAIALSLGKMLHKDISAHLANGDLVLCFSAGGGQSLDEWLRLEFSKEDYGHTKT